MGNFLIYGANGYTGEIIAREAVNRGFKPLLGGRSKNKVEPLAKELGCVSRTFSLEDQKSLEYTLKEVDVVIHCAGPFSSTAKQMANGCIHTNTHYLDITGEIEVFESLSRLDQDAKKAGIMILPGVGFDVVPTDCLALHLKNRLPSANDLSLAFYGGSGISHGTQKTMTINLGKGGAIRRNGKITNVPAAWRTEEINFGETTKTAVTIPWGDVSTAFHSTGIPNIRVFTVMPEKNLKLLRLSNYLGWLLSTKPVQNYLFKQIPVGGPSIEKRERGKTHIWGKASDTKGNEVETRIVGPEGYKFTMLSALEIAKRVLDGDFKAGYQTPAKAYSAELVLDIEGVVRTDV